MPIFSAHLLGCLTPGLHLVRIVLDRVALDRPALVGQAAGAVLVAALRVRARLSRAVALPHFVVLTAAAELVRTRRTRLVGRVA
ncbi:MAG: hypothetical protein M1337_03455 [Actinobacteria bacterium]|nr:hypothetical protein [Actinomycetota bacterium]